MLLIQSPTISLHAVLWRLGPPAAILLLGLAVQTIDSHSKNKLKTNSGFPIVLRYDAWQTAPAFAAVLFTAGIVAYAARILPAGFAKHPHESVASEIGILFGFVAVGIMALLMLGWLLFKMISPDRVTLKSDAIELYSLGRTQTWAWSQIASVEVKTIREARGGTHDIVCLHISNDKKPTVVLPRFLRSVEGPEDAETVCELIRRMLTQQKPSAVESLRQRLHFA